MAQLPEPSQTLSSMVYDWYEENWQKPPRLHLGGSLLGNPCDRWLWLTFRWSVIPKHSGRMLRLFGRGQAEEIAVCNELCKIGMELTDFLKGQKTVDFGRHVEGTPDGIILSGVPGSVKTKHLLEIKTHNKKSFTALLKDGVEKSKPEHYTQCQVYMLGTKTTRALYYAVCKDDDSIYTERIRFNQELAERALERGYSITMSERMPPPLSTDTTWWQCKMCAGHSFCHDTNFTKEVNCRTCTHSTPLKTSAWRCELFEAEPIPPEHQYKGCDDHVFHPDMVPWRLNTDKSTNAVAAWEVEGQTLMNGTPGQGVYASSEIVANLGACLSENEIITSARSIFGGKIVT